MPKGWTTVSDELLRTVLGVWAHLAQAIEYSSVLDILLLLALLERLHDLTVATISVCFSHWPCMVPSDNIELIT